MRIDIFCSPDHPEGCQDTMKNVRQALNQLGVKAEVHQYSDARKMIDNRIYVVPALLVDDQMRVAGRVPEISEIIAFIAEHPRYLQEVAVVV
ncbi:MAG: thioredoxin family protein [Thermodesulfobacteriota bacterium]|nr:thioredoxin family protein [Thermodesulfobacteriota bacterium]